MGLLNVGAQQYAMVGTVNAPGSTIMMCDGSFQPSAGGPSFLIGLLFTGGVMPVGANMQPMFVGHYGVASFADLLPAVQRVRGGALSVLIGL
jgi:hypothetical protein